MDKIFEIATNISTPLSLSGLFGAILFYTIRFYYLKKHPKPVEGSYKSFPHIDHTRQILRYLFILCLTGMCLGFCSFVFVKMYYKPSKNVRIEGLVFIEGKETERVAVKVLEVEKSTSTNFFGKFFVEFKDDGTQKDYVINFKYEPFKIDTFFKIENDSIPRKYYLVKNVNSVVSKQTVKHSGALKAKPPEENAKSSEENELRTSTKKELENEPQHILTKDQIVLFLQLVENKRERWNLPQKQVVFYICCKSQQNKDLIHQLIKALHTIDYRIVGTYLSSDSTLINISFKKINWDDPPGEIIEVHIGAAIDYSYPINID
jgi:hypothetical protein